MTDLYLNNSTKLVLIRGLPGSGKSTLAKSLEGFVHLETDMYFDVFGQYVFDPSKLHLAHDWCFNEASRALRNGYKVVVSNTFVQLWELQRYVNVSREERIGMHIITATGSWESVHNVPASTIERMRNRWED